MTHPATDAAHVIAAKAQRSIARLREDDCKAVEKRRQASALLQIAEKIGADLRYDACAGETPSDADCMVAANEVYSLAMRREAAATTSMFGAKCKPGWVRGGDDFGMPIHPARLRQAIALFDIALSLHDESYWAYSKGLLQERLGDYAGAIQTFENICGYYAKQSGPQLERCRAKFANNYDPEAALDTAFGKLSARISGSGVQQAGFVQEAIDSLRDELGHATKDASDENQAADEQAADGTDDEQLELGAITAQSFAELLVDRDFEAARSMLAKDLEHLKASDLQREFERMIDQYAEEEEETGDLTVCVMSCETDMPMMSAADICSVYVAISGDGFNEAVMVTVTQEYGVMKIRELEWGRP